MAEESLQEVIDRKLKEAVEAPLTRDEVDQLEHKINTIKKLAGTQPG